MGFRGKGRRGWWSGVAVAAVAVGLPSLVAAQQFDVQTLKPMPSQVQNHFGVSSTRVGQMGRWEAGILGHWASNPLILENPQGDRVRSLVADQLVFDLLGTYTVWEGIEVGLNVPLILFQDGQRGFEVSNLNASDTSVGVGDLRLVPKWLLWSQDGGANREGFSVAGLANLYIPIGSREAYQGEGFRLEPRAAVDWATRDNLRVSANVGYLFRPEATLAETNVDDMFTWGVAATIPLPVAEKVSIVPEIQGAVSVLADDLGAEEVPMELLLGAKWFPMESLLVQGGFGTGLSPGVGTPDWRIFLGAAWTNERAEAAPAPEPVRVVEVERVGFDDADGDGILDGDDRCPTEPEDFDGFEDGDGCPDPDNDRDGVLDGEDQCPTDPEDIDGFDDLDGCPDRDNDADGIPDVDDKCPDEAEDIDGFEDMDGCPDPDNDGDGILDVDDKCPDEAEDIDGFEDSDGCPEEGAGKVLLTCELLEIREQVFFETNSDKIKEVSNDLLDQVAGALQAAKYIELIRVEGHTDDRGKPEYNLDLSRRRAEAVRAYLLTRGVDEKRVEAVGYGKENPVADNRTEKGRSANRRVEFRIMRQSGVCAEGGRSSP